MVEHYRRLVEAELDAFLPSEREEPASVHKAMRYSVFSGGKRLRPILTMMAADAVGGEGEKFAGPASAVELLHTYTLIHDDLPCMDDDDLRRGRPTCHKVFGDTVSLLAGDALLSASFEMLVRRSLESGVPAEAVAGLVESMARASGSLGVVGGQVADMEAEGRDVSLEQLKSIHARKTGELFRYSITAGGVMCGAARDELEKLDECAYHFGQLFQITDDILDVRGDESKLGKPIGSDEKNAKATYPSIMGIERSMEAAEEAARRAVEALEGLRGDVSVMRDLIAYVLTRES